MQKLVIPAAASVSGSRAVSFRPTLTPGGLGRSLDRTAKEKTVSSLYCSTEHHVDFLCFFGSLKHSETFLLFLLLW